MQAFGLLYIYMHVHTYVDGIEALAFGCLSSLQQRCRNLSSNHAYA